MNFDAYVLTDSSVFCTIFDYKNLRNHIADFHEQNTARIKTRVDNISFLGFLFISNAVSEISYQKTLFKT